jgi:ComF family protein
MGADVLCGACLRDRPAFDWARAAVGYEGVGRDLVLRMKHGAAGAAVPVMAAMMASALPGEALPDILVPVPLHRRRLLARRFNQSQLLAGGVSSRIGVRVDPFALVRTRSTPSQGTQTKKGRRRNVKGAFAVPVQRGTHIAGATVVLVDDVLTTGATASACAVALKRAGAREVGVLAFARVGEPVTG